MSHERLDGQSRVCDLRERANPLAKVGTRKPQGSSSQLGRRELRPPRSLSLPNSGRAAACVCGGPGRVEGIIRGYGRQRGFTAHQSSWSMIRSSSASSHAIDESTMFLDQRDEAKDFSRRQGRHSSGIELGVASYGIESTVTLYPAAVAELEPISSIEAASAMWTIGRDSTRGRATPMKHSGEKGDCAVARAVAVETRSCSPGTCRTATSSCRRGEGRLRWRRESALAGFARRCTSVSGESRSRSPGEGVGLTVDSNDVFGLLRTERRRQDDDDQGRARLDEADVRRRRAGCPDSSTSATCRRTPTSTTTCRAASSSASAPASSASTATTWRVDRLLGDVEPGAGGRHAPAQVAPRACCSASASRRRSSTIPRSCCSTSR